MGPPGRYNDALRRLLINADDFGLTSGVNRAIVEAHGNGVVTSATLMANAPAFTEAVELARSAPRMSIGCHVVLVDGVPVLPASEIPSLLGNHGQFHSALGGFAMRALRGDFDSRQIEAEISAQIRRLQAAGVTVSHLDTHKHTHIFPQILVPLLRAAKACGVRAIRNPFEPSRLSLLTERPGLWKRWFEVRATHMLSASFRRAAEQAGIATPDGTLGIIATGALDRPLLRSILQNIPEGTWEMVCHPGYDDAQLGAVRTRLRASRALELQLLTTVETRNLLEENKIQLISYHDLV